MRTTKGLRVLLCVALLASFQAWRVPGSAVRTELHDAAGILPPATQPATIHTYRDVHRLDAAKERGAHGITFVLAEPAAAARDRGYLIAANPDGFRPQIATARLQSGRSPPFPIS